MLILTWISGPGQHSPQASSTESGVRSDSCLAGVDTDALELAAKAVALVLPAAEAVPVPGPVPLLVSVPAGAPVAAISLRAAVEIPAFGVRLSFFLGEYLLS
ncbi:hypothetical protein D3C78_1242710 [compost metagenome]